MRRCAWNAVTAAAALLIVAAVPAAADNSVPPTTGAPYRTWRNVRIDGGGFVTGLIPSAAPGGPLFARTDVGGAYRWVSATKQWVPITDPLGPRQVESLAADPVDPNVVYIASSGDICRSADLGATWKINKVPARMAGNGNGRPVGERLAIDPNAPNILFFGSRQDGLFKSTDSGTTWEPVAGFTDKKGEVGITFVLFDKRSGGKGQPSQIIYLGVDGASAGLYRSADAGKSWEAIPGQPQGVFPNHAVLGPNGFLFLAYANGGGPGDMSDGAVWRYSTAGTGGWKKISPVDPKKNSGDFFGYGSIALDPKNPNVLVTASMDRWNWGDAMWRTEDASAEAPVWTELFSRKVQPKWTSPAPYKVRDTHWISDAEFHPSVPDQLFFGFGLGVQRTDNASAGQAAAWTFSAQGIEETVVLALASPPAGPPLLSGLGDIGGFAHHRLDAPPDAAHSTANTSGVDFAELAPAIMARVGSKPGKFSADGGTTWTPFTSQEPGGGGTIAISADGRTFFWMSEAGGFVTRDRGTTWTTVPTLPKGSQIVADRVNPAKFYGFDSKEGKVFLSTDSGATFALSDVKLPGTHDYLSSSIRAVPGFEGHLFVSTQNWLQVSVLHRSTDSGKTFSPVSGLNHNKQPVTSNTSVVSIHGFGFGKAMPGRSYPAVYLAGRLNLPPGGETLGVFRSDDAGTTWIRIDDDRHIFTPGVIVGDARIPGRVYLGTPGRGIVYGDP